MRSSLFLATLFASLGALAAEQRDMGEVVVEETAPQPPSTTPLPLESPRLGGASDTGDILRSITGVQGVRRGGHGVDPVIRGQKETQLNILLDGTFVHGGCPSRMDPPTSYAPLESYDEVTVIKGSQTVLYGTGGTGGTVLFERNTPRFAEGERLRARGGANYTANGNSRGAYLDVTTGAPLGFIRAMGNINEADNYDDGDGNPVRSASSDRAGNLVLGLTPDADTRLELGFDVTRARDTLYPGLGMDSPFSDDDAIRLRLERKAAVGPFSGMKFEAYHSEVEHLMDNFSLRPVAPGSPLQQAPSDSTTRGGRLVFDLASGAHDWTFGVDYQDNERNAERQVVQPTALVLQSVLWPGVTIDQPGIFAELSRPWGETKRIKAGLRYTRVSSEASQANRTPAAPGTLSPNQLYALYYGSEARKIEDDHIDGFLRLEHAPAALPGIVYLGLSRSSRSPDATERFIASNAPPTLLENRWIGNPLLDPERHNQVEIGVELTRSAWELTASVYLDQVDDFILRDRAREQAGILRDDNASIYRNVDARFWGFEADGTYQWDARWSSTASLAFVHASNTTEDRPIAQIPPFEAGLSLDYAAPTWSAGGAARAVARQTRVDTDITTGSGLDERETPGFFVLDLYGAAKLGRHADLRFGVDNVFDRTYAEHLNVAQVFGDPTVPVDDQVQVNEPGRSFWLRLDAKY